MTNITVIGTGYVGLVSGVCFANSGQNVTCVDKNESIITKLNAGVMPFFEPGLSDLFHQSRIRLSFESDLHKSIQSADVVFVAVGTPTGEDGRTDLGATFEVVKQVSKSSNKDLILVLKSTVPIGTSLEVKKICAQNSPHSISVISNPEFLKEGSAVSDFLNPDRVIVGHDNLQAAEVVKKIYQPFLRNDNPVYFMSNVSAEICKYAANSFLATKISFINEVARVADAYGGDINEVRKGFSSDSRIGSSFFHPGLGYGGSCFPKDVKAFVSSAKDKKIALKVVQAAEETNKIQRELFMNKILDHFEGSLTGRQFAMWGLSFKPQTDDVREAPSIYLIKSLLKEGATVVAYDPVAKETALKAVDSKIEVGDDPYKVLESSDALIVATEWNEFREPDFHKIKTSLKNPVLFDGRNIYDPYELKKLGFKHYCFGRESV